MKVVLTNGCFDVLHAGHVDFLIRAKSLGDFLVVAINTDESVRRLKGDGRPLNPYEQRCFVIRGLISVDLVTALESDNMVNLIKSVRPAVWVKGGDYTIGTLNQDEVRAAREVGAEIKIIPCRYATSTTKLIGRIHADRTAGSHGADRRAHRPPGSGGGEGGKMGEGMGVRGLRSSRKPDRGVS